ncbi:fimbrial protein [Klebsiella michiganensis]|uniref:fimbrial protein n=2 Tax=Klebsiella michiganensis TaxID=1134687 RepID=UPI001CE36122|nr:fimbrial protein [Klebsiella michiganensis]
MMISYQELVRTFPKSATVKFDGTADSSVGTILALTQEPGVAQGVGIQLMDNKNVVVPLYTASSAYPLQPGENSLAFVARYYATSSTVNAGFANATSTFTLNYN